MKIEGVTSKQESFEIKVKNKSITIYKTLYKSAEEINSPDRQKRLFASVNLSYLIWHTMSELNDRLTCMNNDFFFYGSAFDSNSFGGEIEPGKFEVETPSLKNLMTPNKNILTGHFIIYFRWGSKYLVVASTGNLNTKNSDCFAPVEFLVDRKERIMNCSVNSVGKTWAKNETIAELTYFAVNNYFELKGAIREIFGSTHSLKEKEDPKAVFKTSPIRWETVSASQINGMLKAIPDAENFISKTVLKKNASLVFEINGGWEQGLGQWEGDRQRFPKGMKEVADSIQESGFIPGIWIAPFVIDWSTDFCLMHRNWVLQNKRKKPVSAATIPAWENILNNNGLPGNFFCLDLSNEEVIDFLNSLMNRIINEWGFRYIKLDLLYAGMIDGEFKNGGAAYHWYKRAVEVLTIRKTNNKGEKIYYEGGGLPLENSFKDLPVSKVGPSTKDSWKHGAKHTLQSTLGHSFWNTSIYYNQPGTISFRGKNIYLNETEKELIALTNLLFADYVENADNPKNFEASSEGKFAERIIKIVEKLEGEEFAVLNKTSEIYYLFTKSKRFCGCINLSDKPAGISKEELLTVAGVDQPGFKAVVNHAEIDENGRYKFAPHSISIFEKKA